MWGALRPRDLKGWNLPGSEQGRMPQAQHVPGLEKEPGSRILRVWEMMADTELGVPFRERV